MDRTGKASVGIFEPMDQATGGRAYRSDLCDVLRKRYDLEVFRVGEARMLGLSARLGRMRAIAKVKQAKDVWIRDFYPIAGMSLRRNPGKNIALVHHIYIEGEESDMVGRVLSKLFFHNLKKCERVVAVSNFWKDHLMGLGFMNVSLIRNSFDPAKFDFSDRELEAFKRRYAFADAPIVYIGNCRKNKGVLESYEALKDRGYTLVTSGEPDVELPCPNFNLPHREYCLLLKASSVVVTMSKFREGWCRTAHEAMLCKTPVVGSGTGGMAELLEGGRQYICRDFSELPAMVDAAMEQRQELGEEGYRFVSELTIERFEREWLSLMEEVLEDESRPR